MSQQRKRVYFAIMGACLALLLTSWMWVRTWSVPVALAMCAVAAVLPPIASVVANRGLLRGGRRFEFEQRIEHPDDLT